MKAFLPPSPSLRTPRKSHAAVSSNATSLHTKAALQAARASAEAADAMLSRSASMIAPPINQVVSPTPSKTKQPTSIRKSQSQSQSGSSRRESEAAAAKSANKPSSATTTTLVPLSSSPSPSSSGENVEVFPSWIRDRKDFQVFFPRYADRVITDDEILRQGVPKDPHDRNIVELQCLARWIMKIPSMATSLDLSQATEIAKLAKYQHFKPREYIFRKGDVGDACYLVFAGEIHILINHEKVASVGKNAAFGDIALQIENATRGADVIAAFNPLFLNPGGVEVLKILAEDYHKTLARCQSRRRKHLITWLHTEVAIFRDCVESKLHFFELVSIDVPLKQGDVLYSQGDSVGAFYIVRSGRVRLEINIQYEHKHRWPRGAHEWEEQVRAVKSKEPFHWEQVGGFFGFEMFVETQKQRAYSVIADSPDVELIALNRVDCFSPYFSFTPRAIDKIMEKHDTFQSLAAKQVHQKLKDFHRQNSQQKRTQKPMGKLPLVMAPKFPHSMESPLYQFPRLQASQWEAGNEVVRALQLTCSQ